MPAGMLIRRFGRTLVALDGIFAFVREFLDAQGLPPAAGFDLRLVIEELFTNMVKHSPGGAPEIEIQLEWHAPAVTAILRDFDVEPFDVTQAPDADVAALLERGRPGGLGLHLVRRLARDLRYEYRDRTSTITVTMRP
jgi:anti-sigma regulatory factor (Ser/Thr protein kinase)